jgi:hypothetical protein
MSIDAKGKRRYPGAQPFADDELARKLFRGREHETTSLTNQIVANRLVLLFARSGLGKTSLLNAGVAESLRLHGLLPLMVRVNDITSGPLESVYDGIKASALRQSAEQVSGDRTSLWHYFKTVQFWLDDVLQTPVLILDQFEELFTLQSEQRRAAFIAELSYLIRGVRPRSDPTETSSAVDSGDVLSDSSPKCRVVISLREDFLPILEEVADRIPEILDQRFRLNPLGWIAASRAIEEPAGIEDDTLATRPFDVDPNGRDMILEFLTRQTPSPIRKSTSDIEPFQLQLICQYIEGIASDKQQRLSFERVSVTLEEIAQGSSLGGILEDFYDKQVSEIKPLLQRHAVRRLCTEYLISPEGRRLRIEESEIERHTGVKPETLKILTDDRLLRSDQTPQGTYYELSHDSLIKPILSSNLFSVWATGNLIAGSVLIVATISFCWFAIQLPAANWRDTIYLEVFYIFVAWLCLSAGIRYLKRFNEMRKRSKFK